MRLNRNRVTLVKSKKFIGGMEENNPNLRLSDFHLELPPETSTEKGHGFYPCPCESGPRREAPGR
jgi:hypothetical protein